MLTHALGTAGVVVKTRHLLLYRHTRIHLDDVAELGTFVELETVVIEQSEAEAELHHVASALALKPEDRVPVP